MKENSEVLEKYLREAWHTLSAEKYDYSQEFPEKLVESLRRGDMEAFFKELDISISS